MKNSISQIRAKALEGKFVDNKDLTFLVREALKRAFPGVKFSVRNPYYSSINVRWANGPTRKEVVSVIGCFETKGFDGMIDLAYSKGFWLYSDGTASHAICEGTEGSCGTVSESIGSSLKPDGVLVTNTASCFVFEDRKYTKEFAEPVIDGLRQKYGTDYIGQVNWFVYETGEISVGSRDFNIHRLIQEALSETSGIAEKV